MPYKRENSRFWWVNLTDASGKRVRRSTGTTDKKEAEALESKWKLESFMVKQWDSKPSRYFDELMVKYLKATANEKRSSDKDVQRTRHLQEFFTGCVLHEIAHTDVRGYITKRKEAGVGNATINRELALLSAALNYANREWDWDVPNKVMGRKLKEPEGRLRWLRKEEANQLLEVAGLEKNAPHLQDFILLALHTGCRSGELLGLEWSRVDLSQGLIWLESRHTKSGKRRSVPLNQTSRRALLNRNKFRLQWCPRSRWVFCNKVGMRIDSVRKSFATARKRAGLDDFRIHDLRHTCAAWLVSSGVPLTEVRDLLGHSTVRMTERYAHLAPENVRAAVGKLDGWSHSGHSPEISDVNNVPNNVVSI